VFLCKLISLFIFALINHCVVEVEFRFTLGLNFGVNPVPFVVLPKRVSR
jgi:hypothetical protein